MPIVRLAIVSVMLALRIDTLPVFDSSTVYSIISFTARYVVRDAFLLSSSLEFCVNVIVSVFSVVGMP